MLTGRAEASTGTLEPALPAVQPLDSERGTRRLATHRIVVAGPPRAGDRRSRRIARLASHDLFEPRVADAGVASGLGRSATTAPTSLLRGVLDRRPPTCTMRRSPSTGRLAIVTCIRSAIVSSPRAQSLSIARSVVQAADLTGPGRAVTPAPSPDVRLHITTALRLDAAASSCSRGVLSRAPPSRRLVPAVAVPAPLKLRPGLRQDERAGHVLLQLQCLDRVPLGRHAVEVGLAFLPVDRDVVIGAGSRSSSAQGSRLRT